MRNRFLFFIPSPRSIPEVKKPIEDLLYQKHDVIWFKYYPELEAYQLARKWFLKNKDKYDYFCIIPDDMALNEEGLNNLFRELENPSLNMSEYGGNYPVLAGVCNYSYLNEQQAQIVVASLSSVTGQYLLTYQTLAEMEDEVIRCAYIGFSCQFIHKSVLEKIDFTVMDALAVDNTFSNSLAKKKIPQFILKTAKFTHYKGLSVKYGGSLSVNPDVIYVNVYPKAVILVDKDKNS